MNILYMISNELDYSKLICHDAGPGYAKTMKWKWSKISEVECYDNKTVYIIDNRISARECKVVGRNIVNHPKIRFLLKIVDPYYENASHYYYLWIASLLHLDNVYLFSIYEPKELTLILSRKFKNKIAYIPYPYNSVKEVPLERLASRLNKIIVTGSINPVIYPSRSEIWIKTRRSLARTFFPVLKHPGYAEIGKGNFDHQYIGDAFVQYLSRYKAMLICPTRAGVELLKFHECAYAGCLPTGEPPSSFPANIKQLFYTIKSDSIFSSSIKLFLKWNIKDHIRTVEMYREFLRKERNVDNLNNSLLTQLQVEPAIYSS